MNVSVIGCSFVGLLNPWHLAKQYPGVKFNIDASAGAGNRAIAAMALDHLANKNPDAVVVLWSGINRIDAPINLELYNTYGNDKNQITSRQVGNQVWIHSGGFGCGGFYNPTPSEISSYFKIQHIGETSEYFTDLSLIDIVGVNACLKAKNIPFYSGFIYDIDVDYSGYNDVLFNKPLEHTLGKISKNSRLYNLVQWGDMQLENTPFEWSKNRNCLDDDQFHPTQQAMTDWFNCFAIPKLGIRSNQ